MQNLSKLINNLKKKSNTTDQDLFNLIREYLQVLILKAIYESKYASHLSFIGGTCLRICYDLSRYSEDLDFTLDRKMEGYSFQELNTIIARFLKNTDFEVDINVKEEKIVQKSFIKIKKVLHLFGLSRLESEKIHIKLEIDTRPVKVNNEEIETFFVTKYNEVFPILKHTDDTLFSRKICAVLNRVYTKGRDFYDLIWYLHQKTSINFSYLNKCIKQAGISHTFKNNKEIIEVLRGKVQHVNVSDIMKDIESFLEDRSQKKWIDNYPAVFEQAAERFLKA